MIMIATNADGTGVRGRFGLLNVCLFWACDGVVFGGFYEQQAIAERWSVCELIRQKESSLFLRLTARSQNEKM